MAHRPRAPIVPGIFWILDRDKWWLGPGALTQMRRKIGRLCGPVATAGLALGVCFALACGVSGALASSEVGPAAGTPAQQTDPAPACAAKRPVVVLDPGHSGGPNFDSTAE